jgi:hypothetical protein
MSPSPPPSNGSCMTNSAAVGDAGSGPGSAPRYAPMDIVERRIDEVKQHATYPRYDSPYVIKCICVHVYIYS